MSPILINLASEEQKQSEAPWPPGYPPTSPPHSGEAMFSLSSSGHLVCTGEFVHNAGCSSCLAERPNGRRASSPTVHEEHQRVPGTLCHAPLELLFHCGSPPPRLRPPSFLVELTFLVRAPCSPWVSAFMSGPCQSPRHKSVPKHECVPKT